MPDAQYAPPFWTGVANAFKGNNAVVFDLFNEPYPDAATNWSKTAGWTCCATAAPAPASATRSAGMQSLVNAVRATGATNVIMVGGLAWTNDLTQWLTYKPTDPTGNIAASWHSYNFNACVTVSCWDSQIAPGRRAGAGACRRDRPEHLRPRLHRPGDGLGRRARRRLPRVDLEPVGLQPGACSSTTTPAPRNLASARV